MSELTRLLAEATRLLTLYDEHKNSTIEWKRRKVHLDLDRFLMENREVAAILLVQGLQDSLDDLRVPPTKVRWYQKFMGGAAYAKRQNISH